MFGYVTANINELSQEELCRYRSCYCGLCHTLNKNFGQPGRITLNYDMTFLVLLLSSLYEPQENSGWKRCIAHPLKRHLLWQNSFTDYAADMNIVLAYYNCIDDWNDDKNILAYTEAALLKTKVDSIIEKYPRQCDAVLSGLNNLSRDEKENSTDLDEVSGHFGKIMSEIFVYNEDVWSDKLRSMAEALGRFIYLMDAYMDLKSDIKKKRYNPLVDLYKDSNCEKSCQTILEMLMAQCADGFERLPLVQDAGLMRNIIYSGVWTKYYFAKSKNESREKVKTNDN